MLTDVEIGHAVRDLRESMELSQAAFAALTRKRGLSWHQPTVSRIEDGERPLRLAEALVLADAFGLPLPGRLGIRAGIQLSIDALTNLMEETG